MRAAPRRAHLRLPTAEEAEFILELWATRRFDTWDIARFTQVHEAVVDRTIHAARDVVRQMYGVPA